MRRTRLCAEGQATFVVNGKSAANAEATAYAEAYASGVAEASVCGKCSAAANFVAESWESIFLKAVASAEVILSGEANGGTVEQRKRDFVENVEDVTVIAYAEVRRLGCFCRPVHAVHAVHAGLAVDQRSGQPHPRWMTRAPEPRVGPRICWGAGHQCRTGILIRWLSSELRYRRKMCFFSMRSGPTAKHRGTPSPCTVSGCSCIRCEDVKDPQKQRYYVWLVSMVLC